MKILLTIIILLVSIPDANHGVEPIPDFAKQKCPQCFKEYVRYSYDVSLPVGMRKALKEYSPTFRIFKMADFAEEVRLRLEPGLSNLSSYSAVFNDFNGDGRFDAVIFGERNSNTEKERAFLILAILSQDPTTYQVVEIESIPAHKPVAASLSLARPGKVIEIGSDGNEAIEMKNYGITVSMGYGTTVYYWAEMEKKFKSIATGGM